MVKVVVLLLFLLFIKVGLLIFFDVVDGFIIIFVVLGNVKDKFWLVFVFLLVEKKDFLF